MMITWFPQAICHFDVDTIINLRFTQAINPISFSQDQQEAIQLSSYLHISSLIAFYGTAGVRLIVKLQYLDQVATRAMCCLPSMWRHSRGVTSRESTLLVSKDS